MGTIKINALKERWKIENHNRAHVLSASIRNILSRILFGVPLRKVERITGEHRNGNND